MSNVKISNRVLPENRIVDIAIAGGLYLFFFINGMLGINFGRHWDEWFFVNSAVDYFASGIMHTRHYGYPTFCNFLTITSSIVFSWFHDCSGTFNFSNSLSFTLFTRTIFLSVASLVGIWVYLIARTITGSRWYGLVAGLFLCSSFELSYHIRWAVSDGIAVQFTCFCLMLLLRDTTILKKVIFGAAGAGLAAGTKYPSGFIVVSIAILMITEFFKAGNTPGRIATLVKHASLAFIVFAVVFICTTPGCLTEPHKFHHDFFEMTTAYSSEHYGHTVHPGIPHLLKMAIWVIFSAFSKAKLISVFFTLLGLSGAFIAFRKKNWNVVGILISLIVFYLIVSRYSIMVIRNIIHVIPFFAVLSAYALYQINRSLKSKRFLFALNTLVAAAFAISITLVISSSLSVYNRSSISVKKELRTFMSKHPERSFYVSDSLRKLLDLPTRGTLKPESYLVFLKDEVNFANYQSNKFMLYESVGGPQDIDINYYPSWTGQDRVMIIKASRANKRNLVDLGILDSCVLKEPDSSRPPAPARGSAP